MRKQKFLLTRPGLISVLSVALVHGAFGQDESSQVSASNIYRPLAYAARDLAEQTNTTITFEELVFEYPGDLQEYQHGANSGIIPKYGEFSFEYAVGSPIEDVLDALLTKYEMEYPGNYEIAGAGGFFHIVPESSRDASGAVVPRESILDQKLTLQMANVTGRDVACEVVRQISREDRKVSCLTDFVPALSSTRFEQYSLENAPARDHLVKVINDSGGNMSWFIFRSTSGTYGVNFYTQP